MDITLHYLFTNDLRISNLDDAIINAAKLIYEDNVPSSTEDKSANNNIRTLQYYFNLDKETNCNYYARNGGVRKVILNFIKKFQYPNYRTSVSYQSAKDNGIVLSPLKETLKLLYVAHLKEGQTSYISMNEVLKFIFFNLEVSTNNSPDYIKVYNDILTYRSTKELPESIVKEENRHWKNSKRQLREMLNVLTYINFITIDQDKLTLVDSNKLSVDEKADIYDIMIDNSFWEGGTLDQYKLYFDLPVMEKFSSEIAENAGIYKMSNDPIQKIYFGPPGTGKSYAATQLIKKTYPNYGIIGEKNSYVFRVMIHPEYSYFDFVGSILPISKEVDGQSKISYDFVSGIFVESLITALTNEDQDVFLIMEEMSRGNIVSIFGELFQLLDRDEQGNSEYTVRNKNIVLKIKEQVSHWDSDEIYLPNNFHIIGTVNTSDQNVFVMDTAFKRRFDFEYIGTKPKGKLNNWTFKIDNELAIDWTDFYPKLNKFIIEKLDLDEDKQLGQFFIKFKEENYNTTKTNEYNYNQIKNKLLQYLWNDIHLIKLTNYNLFSSEIRSFEDLYDIELEDGMGACFSFEFLQYLRE